MTCSLKNCGRQLLLMLLYWLVVLAYFTLLTGGLESPHFIKFLDNGLCKISLKVEAPLYPAKSSYSWYLIDHLESTALSPLYPVFAQVPIRLDFQPFHPMNWWLPAVVHLGDTGHPVYDTPNSASFNITKQHDIAFLGRHLWNHCFLILIEIGVSL